MTRHIHYSDISALTEGGVLDSASLPGALREIRNKAFWHDWGVKTLFALGVGHLLAGIIFFFAYNWNDLTPFLKFAIVQGAMILSVLAWIVLRLDRAAAAFGIAATVLIGVLLAVFGQVFQTPAMIYTPFVLWAGLSLPFAIASKSHAHWAVWLVIAYLAATFYVNTGIRPVQGDYAANLANAGLGLAAFGAVAAYNHFMTDNGKGVVWFRLALLVIGIFFCVAAFSEAFWSVPKRPLIWLLSTGALGLVVFYMYRFRPSVAGLTLVSVGLAAIVIQPIFEVFKDFSENSFVGQVFIVFLWFLLITICLAFAFRHFLRTFGSVKKHQAPADEAKFLHPTQTLSEFSKSSALDEPSVSDQLKLHADQTPWYMELFLGIGGVLTAILASIFVGTLLSITFDIENEVVLMIVGLAVLGLALAARRKSGNLFTRHMFNTFILAGAGLALAGFLILVDWSEFGSIIGIVLLLAIMILVKDRILEFILALGITGFLAHIVYGFDMPRAGIILAVMCTVAAMALMTLPVRQRLYFSAGVAFLFSGPPQIVLANRRLEMITLGQGVPNSGLIEYALLLATMIGAIFFLNRRMGLTRQNFRPVIWLLIPLGLIAVIMPLGSALALLAILVGYIIGSWSIAVVGVLYQIYFLVLFYYDLGITLLEKSILLFVSGIALLVLWGIVQRKQGLTKGRAT